MKKRIALTLLSLAILNTATFAASNFQYSAQQPVPYDPYSQQMQSNLQGYALYVPAGTTCSAVLSQEINSQSATVGQIVNAVLTQDFMFNGNLIAASGSTITGSIVSIKKATFAGKNAQMQIRFTTIRTPYGNVIPISAVIVTDDGTGILKGGTAKDTTKEYAKDAIIGAGSGAVLGTALGAMAGGSVGKGAIYGTALGGGLGLAKAVATKGDGIQIPSNSRINIVFDQPITLGAQ
ncbi:TrbI/VirB10 family protein [bacterium]|nr:TrbI/VirB10 family protein [bacterium]